MKKYILIFATIVGSLQTVFCQQLSKDLRMEWWRDARFGMFIHWGDYAVLGGTYKGHQIAHGGEWIMNRAKIPVREYQQYAKQFDPVKFNADDWVKMAKEAGMKYIVITAKHHDGFAMFKTKASKWNIVDATPYGKDVLKQIARACKKYNVKLGFYYSQAQDWNNPGGAASRKAAGEGWPNPDSATIDAYTKAHRGHWDPVQDTKTFSQYIDDVAVPEVRELLTNYGNVAVLWWDTPTNMTEEAALKLQGLLKLQPNIITNDRLKHPDFPGDTKTPEQKIPNERELSGQDWETCMTMNSTWGYKSDDNKWKSSEILIRDLIDIASKGGNYLLNVGPKADGTFPRESIDRLRQIGAWMRVNSQAIYATKASPLPPLSWGRCTKKESVNTTTLYLSVFDWPSDGKLIVPRVDNKIISAKFLSNNKALNAKIYSHGIVIDVPETAPDKIASVIKLVVKGKITNQNVLVKN